MPDTHMLLVIVTLKFMRILIVLLASILFATLVHGQKLKDIEAIKLNTKFMLELTKEDSNKFSYKIVSTEPFHGELESSSFKLLDEDLYNNQIQGILGIGTFGAQRSIQLLIKSGVKVPLQYKLSIDMKGNDRFKKTSTIQLIQGIPSQEIWPYNIHAIKISNFQKAPFIEETESELDTVCYSTINIDHGNMLLSEQIRMAIDLISSNDQKDKESVEQFENAFESELQPDEWGWFQHQIKKIKSPDIYEKIECPYFERDAAYYYSKRKDNLKLMTLSWGPRWSGGWQPNISEDLLSEFRTKYDILLKSAETTLGAPVDNNNNEDFTEFNTKWQTNNGIKAKASLSLGKYSYLLRFYIYKEN
jgi:hypothetical protein